MARADSSNALADAATAIQLNSKDAAGFLARAEVLCQWGTELGDFDSAIADCNTAIALATDNSAVAQAHYIRGLVYSRLRLVSNVAQ